LTSPHYTILEWIRKEDLDERFKKVFVDPSEMAVD
jgi:hypothetical protein